MGRNSVEATNASLIRAVRARRTALLALGFGLRALFPAVLLVFATVFAVDFAAGFLVVVVEAGPAGVVAEPPEDCPATGCKTMSTERKPAR
jgi:hypothetical protein